MKRITLNTIAILLTAALFSGCADVDGGKSSVIPSTISEQITENSSNVSISNGETSETSSDISSISTACKVYKQKVKTFTEKQLLSFFSVTPERTFYEETDTVIYSSDKENGNLSPNSLFFYTETGLLCDMANGEAYGGKVQSNEEDLASLSRDEVLKIANDSLQNMGFDSHDWRTDKIFAIKAETLDAFKEKAYKSALDNPYSLDEQELQKEIETAQRLYKLPSKDLYYIEFRPECDGIPTYSGGLLAYGSDDKIVMPSSCKIYISKDGIEYFFVSNITETETYEVVNIIEYDTAKEWIDKKYSEIIFDGEVKVNDIELVYIPVPLNDLENINKNFETRPFYAFYCTITENYDGEIISNDIITYFDAVTGNEFATESVGY